MTGLHATIVLIGDDGSWRLGLVAGTRGRALFESLAAARPDAVGLAEEAPDAQAPGRRSGAPIDLTELELDEQAELVWGSLIGRGPVEIDEAIRATANAFRDDGRVVFERLRRDGPVYAAIENAMSWSTRRGIFFDRPRRGYIRALLPDAADFTREHWRRCVLGAIGDGDDWTDRDDLVRASADWAVEMYGLDLQRLRTGGKADSAIRSAINGLIRVGRLERQGGQLLRKAQGHVPPQTSDGDDESPSSGGDRLPSSTPEPPARVDAPPSAPALRAMVGDIPGESEAVFMQLLATPLKTTTELEVAVAGHLKEFEDAFEVHQFLDMTGAERLAADSRRLIERWQTLSTAEKHLAQAAILYFVDSDEADDDFRIGGLRTDKLVMDSINQVVLRERVAP